jgi:hypothetical protein
MTETFDLTPQGMQTPEGKQRVNAKLRLHEAATVALANAATQFFEEHRLALVQAAFENKSLRESLVELNVAIGVRASTQEEFLRAVAGHPAAPNEQPDIIVNTFTELQYTEDYEGPWALYIFGDDGLHSGKQWFAKTLIYPDEQITVEDAARLATEAIAHKKEVRVCDGGDMVVYHAKDGYTTYGEGFWEAVRA